MIPHKLINLDAGQKSQKIYRIISIERLLDILLNKEISFVNPELWDDPYEDFFFKQEFEVPNGKKIELIDLKKDLYGNCWTFNNDNDFSWRVFAPSKNGVQISTTINKISKLFNYVEQDRNLVSFIIGAVGYRKWNDIKDEYEKKKCLDPVFDIFYNLSLFQKRIEFIHENEVRILIRYQNNPSNILKLKVDPNELVDSIVLDPRLNSSDEALYKKLIIKLGYIGEIEKSNLYSIPNMKLKFDSILSDKNINGH